MLKALSVASVVFFLLPQLPAQVLKTADVLATASSDTRSAQNIALQNMAQGLKMHDPLIRQIAARVGINGSSLGDTIYGYLRNEDTYQLQIGFNSLAERRRQRQIKSAHLATLVAENRVLREEALTERYDALVNYLFVAPKLKACQRLDTLLGKEHSILREMLSIGILDVKISKVLDAEEDRNRNRLSLQELENAQALHKNRIRQFIGTDFSELDRSDLVSLTDIQASVAALKAEMSSMEISAQPLLALKTAEIGLEAANLKYINAQNKQVLNNFTAGYQNPLYLVRPNKFNTLNNISFRVGLTVPLPANNRFKKADALFELRDAQNEAAWELEKAQQALEKQFLVLDHLLREHALVEEQLSNSLIRKMLENAALRAQITPLEIVELEIAQQKLLVSAANLEADIAAEWLRLLSVSGAISREESRNFLAR